MTAPEGWQKGSWRGLAFVTLDHEQEGGRRLAVHELPQAEKPYTEDLGKRAGRFTINCQIRGEGYLARAKAFGEALDEKGVGSLVHPWLGSKLVRCEGFTRIDTVDDGGIASFRVDFIETGYNDPPGPTADTPARSKAAASSATQAAQAHAAGEGDAPGLDLDGAAGWVEDAAADVVQGAMRAMAVMAALQGGVPRALSALVGDNGILPDSVRAMLRDPAALAGALFDAFDAIEEIGGDLTSAVDGLLGMLGFGSDLDEVIGGTPARAMQRANQAAIVQLVNAGAAASLTRTIADYPFDSYEEAVGLRDRAADALDMLELRQADAGDDAGAALFAGLRRAIVADVTARGGSLARLQTYLPVATEPALAIAWRLYGGTDLADRAGDIVARNRIAHPGFVPGGVPISVLTPAEARADG